MQPLFTSLQATAPAGQFRRHLRCRLRVASASLIASVLLAACGQPVEATPDCDSATPAQSRMRVLLSFQHPTVGDSPAVLARLQAQALACVRHVSSVSPTLHAYAVQTPADIDTLRARLLGWPMVKAVEADARARRQ